MGLPWLSILRRAFARLRTATLAACLPNACLLCGGDSLTILCGACRTDLPALPAQHCPLCAESTSRGERCGHCLAEPPSFDGTLALYRYAFPLDQLIHTLKYGHQLAVAGWFGECLGEILAGRTFDRIIPLPLHTDRLKERGFNQSAEIARSLGHRLGLPIDLTSCRRCRATPPQAGLALPQRSANIRGAFECTTDLSGQRILLVDDVMTSGATLRECARVLKLHGAARIELAVVARALRS